MKSFFEKIQDLMQEDIDPHLFEVCHNRVLTGPFAGMEILFDDVWPDGNNGLKVLGLYEEELHDTIIGSILRYPRIVVNVGCAAGYYAVGMARRLPEAKIYAFDIDPRQINVCIKNATRNNVFERVEVKMGCLTAEELNVVGSGMHLYIVDCEGAEIDLLNPARCPRLKESDIIVECHDFANKDLAIRKELFSRFKDTHEVSYVESKLPDLSKLNILLSGENPITRALILTEKRPLRCDWLVMRSKQFSF